MNISIREDSRTLREFYPNPALRHQVHYAFAHRFIPQYVHQNPFAFFTYLYTEAVPGIRVDPIRFIHSRWSVIFEPSVGLVEDVFGSDTVFRRVTDLTMTIQELGGRASALITMPSPEQPVEAYLVCVVLLAPASQVASWPCDVPARVFTLDAESSELPEGRAGVVGEWTNQGEHRNFGFAVPARPEAFLQAVTTLLETPGAPAAAGFSPAKDGAPAAITLRAGTPFP